MSVANSVNADSPNSPNLVLSAITFCLRSEEPSSKSLVGVFPMNGNLNRMSSSSDPKSYHISIPTYRNGGFVASKSNGLCSESTCNPSTADMNKILSAFFNKSSYPLKKIANSSKSMTFSSKLKSCF